MLSRTFKWQVASVAVPGNTNAGPLMVRGFENGDTQEITGCDMGWQSANQG